MLPIDWTNESPPERINTTGKEVAVNPNGPLHLSNPATLSRPSGYSHVAKVTGGTMVYIAGQVALDREGRLVGEDDFGAQVRQVFANLNEAVKSAGGSFADVIKLNYYCVDRVDRNQLPVVRETRDEYVDTQAPPVSTFIFVRDLVKPEWLIEIEAVAVLVT
jgi:enamine deaminase RidA (YjgF/YER057c/UK114 family)